MGPGRLGLLRRHPAADLRSIAEPIPGRGHYAGGVTSAAAPTPRARSTRSPAVDGRARPGRRARPDGHRSADLADRQVLAAVHLLHAGRRPGLAAEESDTDRRRDRPADRDLSRTGRADRPADRRRATGPAGRRRADRPAGRAQPASGVVADHQRDRPRRTGRAAGRQWPGPGERLAGHAGSRHLPPAHSPGPAAAGAGRLGCRVPGRAGSGEGERGADAGQPGRGARPAEPGRCAPATGCGSSSTCRWTPTTPGAGRR